MCQVLDDFLGVLCLACSRLAPAKRVEGVLSEIYPGLHPSYSVCCCLPLCPSVGTYEGANRRKGEQQTKCEALGSSLSLFPMAHQRPDQGRSITTAYPDHLAAFRAKCFRHQGQAAVDLGAKVTYMCPLKYPWEAVSLLRWTVASISLNQIRRAIPSRKVCAMLRLEALAGVCGGPLLSATHPHLRANPLRRADTKAYWDHWAEDT